MRRAVTAAIAILGVLGVLATSIPAGAADYDDPFFLNWPEFLPAIETDYVVSESDVCKTGQIQCVDNAIREMTKRYNRLECDHDSTFAFTYLLTTEEYRRAVEDPEFFSDNAFINHQDALFADYYFDQFDAFHRGDLEKVSPAWRIAFQSAEDQKVSGTGNLFLGMNAHVNRDLPLVLAEIGLTKPDGTSRKPDHDRVNDFLAATNQYLLVEAAKYLDPTLDDADVPGISVDNSVTVQALVLWREGAWRNAERIVAAPTPEARAQVIEDIETQAAIEALTIRETFSYTPLNSLLGQGPSQRNAFCDAHFVAR